VSPETKAAAKQLFDEIVERTPRLKEEKERRERYLRNLYRERHRIDRAIASAGTPTGEERGDE